MVAEAWLQVSRSCYGCNDEQYILTSWADYEYVLNMTKRLPSSGSDCSVSNFLRLPLFATRNANWRFSPPKSRAVIHLGAEKTARNKRPNLTVLLHLVIRIEGLQDMDEKILHRLKVSGLDGGVLFPRQPSLLATLDS